jgi:uncharacterized repeat protein (TIGR01451 family)
MYPLVRLFALAAFTVLLAITTIKTPAARQDTPSYGLVDLGLFVVPTTIQDYGFPFFGGHRHLAAQNVERAFIGNDARGLQTLGTLGGSNSFARAMNIALDTVGESQTASHVYHAFVTDYTGAMKDLGTLGGSDSFAYGINDTGAIVGGSRTTMDGNSPTVAFIYRDGVMSPLGATFGGANSLAFDINNLDQVVGYADWPSTSGAVRAFLYDNGTTTNLGSLGGSSIAYAINDSRVIVGHSMLANSTVFHAFRWQNGGMQDLGTLGGKHSHAAAINSAATIGGWAENAEGKKRAVIWRNGQVLDVNTLIPPGSDWVLEEVTSVGHRDALVGWGRRGDGLLRGFMATPPIDMSVSVSRHENQLDTNIPNPHEAGRLTLGASVFNNGDFTATNVKIRDTISGPIEYVSWRGADCVQNGQTLTCTMPFVQLTGRDVIIETRTTGPGPITHSATLIQSDQVDSNPSNNQASETNTAVSLASLALAQSTVTGGQSVLTRVTLTSTTPSGGGRVQLTSSRPDIAVVPAYVDVLPWDNDGLWREFYVATKAVSAPTTVQISGTYGLRTHSQSLTLMPSGSSWPYGDVAHAIPGKIEAEDFDGGGQNVAYYDTGGGNDGGAYRNTDVDIERTTDTNGGFNVGWMASSEWLQYTVNVANAGTYRLDLRVAANGPGGRVHVTFNGADKTGAMNIPNTGGWQNWVTISAPVTLAAGIQRMRVMVDAAGATGVVGNLNHISLVSTSSAPGSTPYTGTPVPLPGIVQAENFDNGGANVAYLDTTAGNSGGAYRSTDVDIQVTTDSSGGYNVGWMAAGEWLNYSVNVPTAGSYRLDLRVAANGAGGRLHVEFNGVDKTGAMTIPNTGGWQAWQTISAPVTLSAGVQRMRVVVDAAGATGVVGNVNYIAVVAATPPPGPTDIVIYAADVNVGALNGSWSKGSDGASPAGVSLVTTDIGFAVASSPLASPADYFDVSFTPVANTPYTLWLRLKALNDSKYNDAVWVQFSGAYANGSPIYPIGTTSGLLVNLATNSAATSLNNWGWANGAYWLSQAATFTFPSGGSQTLRVQVREDGVQVDQIVLSPKNYLSAPPGGPTNDGKIVPKP